MDATFTIPVSVPTSSNEERSLLEFLDLLQLNCLNESHTHRLNGIVSKKAKNTSPSYLLSDADEQLLLNVHFNQAVRVRSIVLQSSVPEQAPKTIKLLINRPSLGFDDVENANEKEFAQAIELSEADVRHGGRVPLRFVRFQSVNSLHIFVASNQGGADETRIDVLDIWGMTVETTRDLSALKAQEDQQ